MNQESLEAHEMICARNYQAHEKKSEKTLLLGIILIIAVMYIFLFIENAIKWPLIGVLAVIYLITRIV